MKIFKVKDNYENKNLVTAIVDEDDPSLKVTIHPLDENEHMLQDCVSGRPHAECANKKTYGVNWQACSTVTVEKAKEYIKLMEAAIQEAEKLNK